MSTVTTETCFCRAASALLCALCIIAPVSAQSWLHDRASTEAIGRGGAESLKLCQRSATGWPGLEGEARNPGASFANAQSSPGHPTPILSLENALEPVGWNDSSLDAPVCYGGPYAYDTIRGQNCSSRFRLSEITIYPTFSYRGVKSATYNEFEFASFTDLGCWEMENRTVLNVADLPSTIKLGPTNPGLPPTTLNVRASGFGDILSGFFFGRKDAHANSHLRIGPVWTFPTATDDNLGSGQWTVGPGVHYSTDIGRLTAGFFLWQSWGFAVDDSHKRINQLFGKPFLIYELCEKWNLVYIPLGMSYSWEAKSGEDWTVPIGGGIRRLFDIRGRKVGLQAQAFDYVARKPYDPEWELRFTIEFLLDELGLASG